MICIGWGNCKVYNANFTNFQTPPLPKLMVTPKEESTSGLNTQQFYWLTALWAFRNNPFFYIILENGVLVSPKNKHTSRVHEYVPFLGQFWSYKLGMGSVVTNKGQVGYFWQHVNYIWHFARCCRTTGCSLQNDWGVLAGSQCGWQSAKSEKNPRPKYRAMQGVAVNCGCGLQVFKGFG